LSRIWRSQDLATRARSVDFSDQRLAPPARDLPRGAFQGLAAGERAEPPLSHLERSELEARRLVESARAEAETIQRDAYHAGFEQGERAGRELALQKIEPTIQMFMNLIEGLKREREEQIRRHENELIKIAFLIAAHILRKQVELHPEVVREVVEAALAKVDRTQHVHLFLAPNDCQLIQQQLAFFESHGWPPEHLHLEPDPTITRGGCRVETETGNIDATIETQLKAMKTLLWDD